MNLKQSLTSSASRHPLATLILLAMLILLPGNDVIIPDIMESRNLITAREMVSDGHWIVPTMNGELRLEKPPLPTWVAAWTSMLVGEAWPFMRLVPALMAILLLVFFYRYCRDVAPRAALASSLILLTCYNFVLAARTVSWDIYCHAFQMAGIFYLSRLLLRRGNAWRNALLAGIMTGLSILSKGPVSPYALLLPWLIAWLITQRRDTAGSDSSQQRLWPKIIVVIVTALIVGGLWYAYIWHVQSTAGMATLDKETTAWQNRNVRPWYYYWSFFTETGIWIPLCLAALLMPLFRKAKALPILDKPYRMALVWTLATLVLLSLMPEKKNRYLLPILLPASLMMGTWLMQQLEAGHRWLKKAVAVVTCLFVLLACAGMPLLRGLLTNAGYTAPAPVMAESQLNGIDLREQYIGVPAYWAQGEELRIELVYDMGRKVTEADLLDSATVAQLPRPALLMVCVTLSKDSLQLDRLGPQHYLGTFDANRHAKGKRRYKPFFIYDLILLDE